MLKKYVQHHIHSLLVLLLMNKAKILKSSFELEKAENALDSIFRVLTHMLLK